MTINLEVAKKVLSIVDKGLTSGLGVPQPGRMCVEAAVNYAFDRPHGDNPPCVTPALRLLKISLNDQPWSSYIARAKGLRRLALAQLGSTGVLDQFNFAHRISESVIRKQVPIALRAAASLLSGKSRTDLIAAAFLCEEKGTQDAVCHAMAVVYTTTDDARATSYVATAAQAAACAAANVANRAAAEAAILSINGVSAARTAAHAAAASAYAVGISLETSSSAAHTTDKVLGDFAEDVVKILIAMNAPGCQWLTLTEEPKS